MTNIHNNYRSLNYGFKGKTSKLSTVSSVDAQESIIYDFIKEWEKAETFEDKLDSLRGKLCDMLFTQTGSRFIQKQLSEENNEGSYQTLVYLNIFFFLLVLYYLFLHITLLINLGSSSIEEMKAKNEENRIMIHNFTTFILEEIGDKVNELMIDR